MDRTRQVEWDRQNWTGRKGQVEEACQSRLVRKANAKTGFPRHDSYDMTTRSAMSGGTGRMGQAQEDRSSGTGRAGHEELDRQNWTL